jgi:hypothetical protein
MAQSISLSPSDQGVRVFATLSQFDKTLVSRYQRSDASLTVAEKEYAKERLDTSLTAPKKSAVPVISVEKGRRVLLGILDRQRLSNQKSLSLSGMPVGKGNE